MYLFVIHISSLVKYLFHIFSHFLTAFLKNCVCREFFTYSWYKSFVISEIYGYFFPVCGLLLCVCVWIAFVSFFKTGSYIESLFIYLCIYLFIYLNWMKFPFTDLFSFMGYTFGVLIKKSLSNSRSCLYIFEVYTELFITI